MDQALSSYAERLLQYSEEARTTTPDGTPENWIETGVDRLAVECGHDFRRFADNAVAELAARYVFGGER